MHGRGFAMGFHGGYGGYAGAGAMEMIPEVIQNPYMAQVMAEQAAYRHPYRHHYPSSAGSYLPEVSMGYPQQGGYEGGYNPAYNPGALYGPHHFRHPHVMPHYGYGGYNSAYNPNYNSNYENQYSTNYANQNGSGYYNNYNQQGYYNPQQYYGRGSFQTYDGAHVNPTNLNENVRIVAQVAQQRGIDPVAAVAAMLVESGGDNTACGDNGNSFGLFQLNRHGELGNLSPQQAFNPYVNAQVALSHFQSGYCSNPGEMAANAQRPGNRWVYAQKVNSKLNEARSLISQCSA